MANNHALVSEPSAASPAKPAGARRSKAAQGSRGDGWLALSQPRLGTAGLVALLCAANLICPLSLDMYTPAVPSMPEQFGTSAAMVNLTITLFYLFFSLGMLVFGPVCDRLGRKPVLVGGVAAFTAGSALCAAAWSIWALIAFRVIQALGAGAVCAVSTAIIKDAFRPERRTALLSLLQVLMVIGPVAVPLLGGLILRFSTWHTTFVALALVGAACLALALAFQETLPASERVGGGVMNSLSRMGKVAKNRGFSVFLVIESLFSVPYMAYVAVASYVYVGHFGASAQTYTYFFAATAALSVPGPLIYLRLERAGVTPRHFTYALLGVSMAAGVLLAIFGEGSMWAFFACFALFALAEASIRPYATNILLSQNDEDAGSASALINFSTNIFGVVGMGLISLWAMEDYARGLGVILLGSMALAIALWAYLLGSKNVRVVGLDKK